MDGGNPWVQGAINNQGALNVVNCGEGWNKILRCMCRSWHLPCNPPPKPDTAGILKQPHRVLLRHPRASNYRNERNVVERSRAVSKNCMREQEPSIRRRMLVAQLQQPLKITERIRQPWFGAAVGNSRRLLRESLWEVRACSAR